MDAVGDARSNADVFGELLERTGLLQDGDPRGELEEMLNVLNQLPEQIGNDLRDHASATPPFEGRPVQFQTVWPLTADRRADLFPEHLDAEDRAGQWSV